VKMRVRCFTTTLTTLEALHLCYSQPDTYADGNPININSLPPLSGLTKHQHSTIRNPLVFSGPSFTEHYYTETQQTQQD
jgi:hypothetical protein